MKEWNLTKYIPEWQYLPHARANVQALEDENERTFHINTKGMFQKQFFLFPNYPSSPSDVEAHRIYSMLIGGSLRIRGASDVRSLGDEVSQTRPLSIDSLLDISCSVSEIAQKKDSHLYVVDATIIDENNARIIYKSLVETNTPQFQKPAVTFRKDDGVHYLHSKNFPESSHKREHELCVDWNVPHRFVPPQLYRSVDLMIRNAMKSWGVNYHSTLGITHDVKDFFSEGETINPWIKLRLKEETDSHILFEFEYRAHKHLNPNKTYIQGLCIGHKTDEYSFSKKEKEDSNVAEYNNSKKDTGAFLPPTNSFKPHTPWRPGS